MRHYYYLHTNGCLIGKPAVVVDSDPQYFDSDFVRHVWAINTDDRMTAVRFLHEARAYNALPEEIEKLEKAWDITPADYEKLNAKEDPKFDSGDSTEYYVV